MARKRARFLVLVALLPAVGLPAGFIVASHRANQAPGLPLDDSWIHLRYADNLAAGHGLSLNKGEPTPGATSPLWVGLIAAARRLGIPPVAAGQGLGILFSALAVVAAYHLACALTSRGWAVAAAWLCGCSGVLAWSAAGSMEVGLFSFLALHAVRLHLVAQGRWRQVVGMGVLLGLATLARPEALGLLAVLAASELWTAWLARSDSACVRRSLAQIGVQALIALTIAAPYAWFCWVTTGRPLPTTFYVKAGAPLSLGLVWRCVLEFGRTLGSESTLIGLACLAGLVAVAARAKSRPRHLALAGWVVGLPLAYGVLGNTEAGANFGRHFYILFPFVMVVAMAGLSALAGDSNHEVHEGHEGEGRKPNRARRWAAVVLLALLSADLLWHARGRARLFVLNVKNVNEMQVAAAHWVRENVPRRATVAVNDIGAMAFFADRPVIDLRGIATPAILPVLERYGRPGEPTRDSGALEFVKRVRPDYLVVFPEWYPRTLDWLLARRMVTRVKSFKLDDNVTCGGDVLVVLRAEWGKGRR